MGIDSMNNISIIIRILFAVTIFQHKETRRKKSNFGVLYNQNHSDLEAMNRFQTQTFTHNQTQTLTQNENAQSTLKQH
jgi:hypothetical protein